MRTIQSSRVCPSCQSFTFDDRARGNRSCPQCGLSVILSKAGLAVRDKPKFSTAGQRKPTALKRLYEVAGASENVTGRHDITINPDARLTVLCAACAQPTVPGIDGIDGRIDSDGSATIRVQAGTDYVVGPDLKISERPRFELRFLPLHIRGIICRDCQSQAGFRPILDETSRKITKRQNERGSVIRSVFRNTKEQDKATEALRVYMAVCRENGTEPNLDLMLGTGAYWSGVVFHVGKHVVTSAGGQKRGDVSGRDNRPIDWSGKASVQTLQTLHGRSDWLRQGGVVSIGQGKDGELETVFTARHPALCPCLDCLRRETFKTFNPIAHIDRAVYVGPANATHEWTGRLPRTTTAMDSDRWFYSRPAAAKPIERFRPSLPMANEPIVSQRVPRRPVIHDSGNVWLRVIQPVYSGPVAPISGKFSSRPLPKRAIPLRPV